jgi:ornithine--oxo-acid transaminase
MISSLFRKFGASVDVITLGGEQYIAQSARHSANIYKELPIVLTKGRGVWVWDTAGTKYLDFVAGYGALNHGHCHPYVQAALEEQAKVLTLTSRAFYSD